MSDSKAFRYMVIVICASALVIGIMVGVLAGAVIGQSDFIENCARSLSFWLIIVVAPSTVTILMGYALYNHIWIVVGRAMNIGEAPLSNTLDQIDLAKR